MNPKRLEPKTRNERFTLTMARLNRRKAKHEVQFDGIPVSWHNTRQEAVKEIDRLAANRLTRFVVLTFAGKPAALGYVTPQEPHKIYLLATRAEGAHLSDPQYVFNSSHRDAVRADFDLFRVSSEGYEKDTENYAFPEA